MVRNTDADWQAISKEEPYYGVLTDPRFLRANIDEQARRDFFASGDHDVSNFLSVIRAKIAPGFTPVHAVDFGCGVGRLALAMAPHAGQVTGVDVSPSMLAEGRAECQRRQITNVTFKADLPREKYDWVNSYLVFQHILPERGFPLLDALLSGLAIGGMASIHLTAFRTISNVGGNLDDLALLSFDGYQLNAVQAVESPSIGQMRMYDYDMTRVLALFAVAGFQNYWLEHLDHAGHHAFRIIGQKTR